MDLGTFINKSGCECLNESDDYHLPAALAKGPDYLESDCDEQVQENKLSHTYARFVNVSLETKSSFNYTLIPLRRWVIILLCHATWSCVTTADSL